MARMRFVLLLMGAVTLSATALEIAFASANKSEVSQVASPAVAGARTLPVGPGPASSATNPAVQTPAVGGGEVPAAKSDPDAPWKAVERIDNKIANAFVAITAVIAFLVLVIGIYEFVKLGELEKINRKIDDRLEDVLKISESRTVTLFQDNFDEFCKKYEARLSEKLLQQIAFASRRIADEQFELNTVAYRVMLCFAENDLRGAVDDDNMTISQMRACMDLQRTLGLLRTPNEENLTGLSHLSSLTNRISDMTAAQVLHYLVVVRRSKILTSWSNQALCADVIQGLEDKTGISAEDSAFKAIARPRSF